MTTTIRRYYYRCTGCLDVMTQLEPLALEYSRTVAKCGTCDQVFEYLGRTQRDRLVQDSMECKCDDRCTSARGPHCNCHCGGENHGAGMVGGYEIVTRDAGPVPIVRMPDPVRAAKALAQYREYDTARTELGRRLGELLDRRAAREFLPRPDFDRMLSYQRINRAIGTAKTHAGRMKSLRTALDQSTVAA